MNRRRWVSALAAAIVTGLPTAAYCIAPTSASARHAEPGSNLGGFNSHALGAGVQIAVELPGIAPLGDAVKGDFLQVQVPYSVSSTETGPTAGSSATPAWPGPVVSNGGNDLQTFNPAVPQALVDALNYGAVANSVYPGQVHVGTHGSYSPPGGSQAGVGTATSESSKNGTKGTAIVNQTTPLGAAKGVGGAPLLKIGSATATTKATINAGSVITTARTHVTNVVVAGLIKIDEVTSVATALSDGKRGAQHTSTHVGKVTVGGIPASIDRKGIKLQKKPAPLGLNPVGVVNHLLSNLLKSGFSIRTIAPSHKVRGRHAEATSGGVQIRYLNKHVPNLQAILPQAPVPFPNAFGLDVNLGLSQVEAAATPYQKVPVTHTKPPKPIKTDNGGGHHVTTTTTGGSTGGGDIGGGGLPPATGTSSSPPQASPIVAQPAAQNIFGLPVRVGWVLLALLLSMMLAGPLLAYANWQLLRGRTP